MNQKPSKQPYIQHTVSVVALAVSVVFAVGSMAAPSELNTLGNEALNAIDQCNYSHFQSLGHPDLISGPHPLRQEDFQVFCDLVDSLGPEQSRQLSRFEVNGLQIGDVDPDIIAYYVVYENAVVEFEVGSINGKLTSFHFHAVETTKSADDNGGAAKS